MTDKNNNGENENKIECDENSEKDNGNKEMNNTHKDSQECKSMDIDNDEEENSIEKDNGNKEMNNNEENEKKEVDKLFNDIKKIWQQPDINNLSNFTSSLSNDKEKNDKEKNDENKINIDIKEKKSTNNSLFSPNKKEKVSSYKNKGIDINSQIGGVFPPPINF